MTLNILGLLKRCRVAVIVSSPGSPSPTTVSPNQYPRKPYFLTEMAMSGSMQAEARAGWVSIRNRSGFRNRGEPHPLQRLERDGTSLPALHSSPRLYFRLLSY